MEAVLGSNRQYQSLVTNHRSLFLPSSPKESSEYRVQGEPTGTEAEDDQRCQEKWEFGCTNKFVRMSPDVQDGVSIRDPVSDRH